MKVVAAYYGWSDSRNIANQSVTLGAPLGTPKEFLDPVAMKAIANFMDVSDSHNYIHPLHITCTTCFLKYM
jgi:hypothetical protein